MKRIKFIDDGRLIDISIRMNVKVRNGVIVEVLPSYKELIGVPIDKIAADGSTKLSDFTTEARRPRRKLLDDPP